MRPALVAVLMHVAVVMAAVATGVNSAPADHPAARDTVRLDLAPSLPVKSRAANQSHPAPRGPMIPAPPSVPSPEPEPLRVEIPRPEAPADAASGIDLPALTRSSGPSAAGFHPLDSVIGMAEVERLPELVNEVRLRYPEALLGSGLSGAVELEYVILSSGRIDAGSMRVRASLHPAFSAAAKEALLRARFIPALRAGRPVAVLVRQSIRFLNR
jgi:protein TonB